VFFTRKTLKKNYFSSSHQNNFKVLRKYLYNIVRSLFLARKTPLFWVYPQAKSTKGALSIDGANLCYSLGPLGECRETFIEQIKVNYLSKNKGTKWRISDHLLPNYIYEDEAMVDFEH